MDTDKSLILTTRKPRLKFLEYVRKERLENFIFTGQIDGNGERKKTTHTEPYKMDDGRKGLGEIAKKAQFIKISKGREVVESKIANVLDE